MISENLKASTDSLFFMPENESSIAENREYISENMDAPQFHKYLESLVSERNIGIPEFGVPV